MQPFTTLSARATPLIVDNVDTDMITPIARVLEGRAATVEFAFEPLRFDSQGQARSDCPLNDAFFAGAEILITGANFACGSSRETAVWAVAGLGFRAVIAPSFGDIFYSNCFKNGLLPLVLSEEAVSKLALVARSGQVFEIDLPAQTVHAAEVRLSFDIPPFRKEALMAGLDELGLMLGRSGAMDRFEQEDRVRRPWVYELERK